MESQILDEGYIQSIDEKRLVLVNNPFQFDARKLETPNAVAFLGHLFFNDKYTLYANKETTTLQLRGTSHLYTKSIDLFYMPANGYYMIKCV